MSISVDTIAGPDGASFKFETVGDTVKGIIVHAEEMVRENQFNRQDEKVIRISLEQDDGAIAIIWPVTDTNVETGGYASRMAKAIAAAVRSAGETRLENGGTLAVKFDREIPTDKGNPAKGFVAQYKAPAVPEPTDGSGDDGDDGGAVDDLL